MDPSPRPAERWNPGGDPLTDITPGRNSYSPLGPAPPPISPPEPRFAFFATNGFYRHDVKDLAGFVLFSIVIPALVAIGVVLVLR